MEPRQIVAYSKLFLALLVAVTLFGLLIPTVRISGIAQSVQERQVEENIPKTLPLEVKLKVEKEHKFKDLNNSEWLRDFELEVSNTPASRYISSNSGLSCQTRRVRKTDNLPSHCDMAGAILFMLPRDLSNPTYRFDLAKPKHSRFQTTSSRDGEKTKSEED